MVCDTCGKAVVDLTTPPDTEIWMCVACRDRYIDTFTQRAKRIETAARAVVEENEFVMEAIAEQETPPRGIMISVPLLKTLAAALDTGEDV